MAASKLILTLCVFAVASAITADSLEQFQDFIRTYNKRYESEDEFRMRLDIFTANLERAAALNTASKGARFGVTKFADLSPSEFEAKYLATTVPSFPADWPYYATFDDEEIAALPTAWDWRTHNAVTAVKNQGDCGSCWSFSTTGNIEGQWALAGNTLVGLSEQNLVDCDHQCMTYEDQQSCDDGCNGGLMPNAFTYVMKNGGIDTESSYPYEGVDDTCRFNSKNVGATITNFTLVAHNETQMQAVLVAQGPMSIAVDANMWQFYLGGIFDVPFCGSALDHGVLIVGYAQGYNLIHELETYWIIKNSWGADWGEDGYIYMKLGKAMCGITEFPCTSYIGHPKKM